VPTPAPVVPTPAPVVPTPAPVVPTRTPPIEDLFRIPREIINGIKSEYYRDYDEKTGIHTKKDGEQTKNKEKMMLINQIQITFDFLIKQKNITSTILVQKLMKKLEDTFHNKKDDDFKKVLFHAQTKLRLFLLPPSSILQFQESIRADIKRLGTSGDYTFFKGNKLQTALEFANLKTHENPYHFLYCKNGNNQSLADILQEHRDKVTFKNTTGSWDRILGVLNKIKESHPEHKPLK
jgi:hypothetical protein